VFMFPEQLIEELLQYIVLIVVWRSRAQVAAVMERNIILFHQIQ
jgi:hypothetical protein